MTETRPNYNGEINYDGHEYIETYTGRKFFINDENPEFNILDIAHALSNTGRYTGHSREFYSVAQHSLIVSGLSNNPLEGLLHDATEAYLNDIAAPFKHQLSQYKELEDRLYKKLAARYGLNPVISESTKIADRKALFIEAYTLFPKRQGRDWKGFKEYGQVEVLGARWDHWSHIGKIFPLGPILTPAEAKIQFIERFHELYKGT